MIVRLGAEAGMRAMRAVDLSVHFQRTGLPVQAFQTYENLAAFYNAQRSKGVTDSDIAKAIMAQKAVLFISGDAHSVAYGVIAVASTIRQGTAIADVSTSPTWKEAYDMGIGKVTGNWDTIPWGKLALAVGGAVLAYGFVTGMGKGVVSR